MTPEDIERALSQIVKILAWLEICQGFFTPQKLHFTT
jgi:hypothetical protein